MSRIKQREETQSVISVREAANAFLADPDVKRLFQKTQDEYRYGLMQFAEWCEQYSLVQSKKDATWSVVKVREKYNAIMLHRVNAHAVHLFLEHIQETHKPAKNGKTELSGHTLAMYVKCVKRLLNWCLEDELYAEHVSAVAVRRIKKPPMEQVIIDVFTDEDIDALYAAADKEYTQHLRDRDRAILSLLLDSGLRATELVTLTMGNLDLSPKDAHARVYGKGRKWGEVGFGERARRDIQRYVRQWREPTIEGDIEKAMAKMSPRQAQQFKKQATADALVFVNRSGNPLTKSGLDQIFQRLGEWAGIEGVRCSPHTCRHWYSLNFIRQGGDIYTLSKLLRHSSVKVTENYLRALQQSEARRRAKSVLDNR